MSAEDVLATDRHLPDAQVHPASADPEHAEGGRPTAVRTSHAARAR